MSQTRQVVRQLGISGIAFLVALALYLIFYFSGLTGLLLLDCCFLLPLGLIVAFGAFGSSKNRPLLQLDYNTVDILDCWFAPMGHVAGYFGLQHL